MITATSFAKVGLAASILFPTAAATVSSDASRMTNKRFIAFLLLERLLVALTCGLRLKSSEILFVYGVVKVTDHHLVPCLLPPPDELRRVGIELILRGVVEVRDAFKAAAFGRGDFLRENVSQLPVEIPTRDGEQNF